jgi:hypothetical protein
MLAHDESDERKRLVEVLHTTSPFLARRRLNPQGISAPQGPEQVERKQLYDVLEVRQGKKCRLAKYECARFDQETARKMWMKFEPPPVQRNLAHNFIANHVTYANLNAEQAARDRAKARWARENNMLPGAAGVPYQSDQIAQGNSLRNGRWLWRNHMSIMVFSNDESWNTQWTQASTNPLKTRAKIFGSVQQLQLQLSPDHGVYTFERLSQPGDADDANRPDHNGDRWAKYHANADLMTNGGKVVWALDNQKAFDYAVLSHPSSAVMTGNWDPFTGTYSGWHYEEDLLELDADELYDDFRYWRETKVNSKKWLPCTESDDI